ncbi:MAG TPA: hypothetical protein ACFE0H_02635 [Elainellaceae cyanobacterium]
MVKTFRFSPFVYILPVGIISALAWLQPAIVSAQELSLPDEEIFPESTDESAEESVDPGTSVDEDDLRPLAQDGSLLSPQGGDRLMREASNAIAAQDYELAARKLQEARQVFNQLSNFYQELAASFSGIDNRISDSQRTLALETAQMRDQATYQLALVHRAQNQPELAVPLLIQIIRSQQPTRDLGQRAYRQLFELGFVDSPYPRNQDAEPTSSIPNR